MCVFQLRLEIECYMLPVVEGLLALEDFIKICPKCIMSAPMNPFAMVDRIVCHRNGNNCFCPLFLSFFLLSSLRKQAT